MKQLHGTLDLSSIMNTGILEQVCFGPYTVILKFHRLTIAITSLCDITTAEDFVWRCDPENDPGEVKMFVKLFNSAIESYSIVPAPVPELILHFSNKYRLTLREYGNYESFTFYYDDGSFLEI
jgi:hypothetical protein